MTTDPSREWYRERAESCGRQVARLARDYPSITGDRAYVLADVIAVWAREAGHWGRLALADEPFGPPHIASVLVFPNGMVAVCDQYGQQMPEYQGRWVEQRAHIEADAPPVVMWTGTRGPHA